MTIQRSSKCCIKDFIDFQQKLKAEKYSVMCVLLFIMVHFPGSDSVAQNLEKIGKGKIFGISGGLNANTVFYDASGIERRRDPFNYFLSGNLNFSIYDWSVPFTFSYSNQQTSFHQPFNQYGLSPTYKWITFHAGYRSMTFSNYTMNGHLFLGGGVDVVPNNKFKISAFYGRLQKAVEEDTLYKSNVPTYQRMAGGIKITLGDQTNFIDMIVFKAKDNVNSLRKAPVYGDVKPEENLVLGFNFGTSIVRNLILKGEFGSSAISKDIRSEETHAGSIYDKVSVGFQPRASSSYYHALKSSLQYSFTNLGVGLAYERIDPGYRTLGAYYFNNNLENLAVTTSAVLFGKKARLNGQFGLQRNNLNKSELNTMNRISGALNFNYQVSPRLMYNVSYSNFQTVINFKSQFDYINRVNSNVNIDTLNYRQIAQNANGSVNYVINESKERRQNVSLNMAFQKTSDEQANIEQPTGAKFYNINSNYTIAWGEKNLTFNVAANANITNSQRADNSIYGPSVSMRKTFFDKKLSSNITLSYNSAQVNGVTTSSVTNLRMGTNYTWKEKHQFDFSLTRVNRVSPQSSTQKEFSELTIQVGYNYNFSMN